MILIQGRTIIELLDQLFSTLLLFTYIISISRKISKYLNSPERKGSLTDKVFQFFPLDQVKICTLERNFQVRSGSFSCPSSFSDVFNSSGDCSRGSNCSNSVRRKTHTVQAKEWTIYFDIADNSFTLDSRALWLAELWRFDLNSLREHLYLFNRPSITPKDSLPPPNFLPLFFFLLSNTHSFYHLPSKNKVCLSEVE